MCWLDCLSLNWVEPGDSPSRLVGKGVHPQCRRQSPPQDWLGVQVGQGPQRLPNEDISELIKQAARFYHLARTPWSPAALPAVSGDPAGMPSSRRHSINERRNKLVHPDMDHYSALKSNELPS